MAAYSGANGKVLAGSTAVANITKWAFDTKASVDKFCSSSNSGSKVGVVGTYDGSGSFDFKLDDTSSQYDTSPGVIAGAGLTLKLYLDATLFISVPAIIESCHYEVDINDGPSVVGSANFTTHGAWSFTAA